jgi:hypothetical protein
LEVAGDGADQAEVLLVWGRFLDGKIFDDRLLHLAVVRINSIVIAVDNINAFLQDEVSLIAVPLVSIQINYHNPLHSQSWLQVMDKNLSKQPHTPISYLSLVFFETIKLLEESEKMYCDPVFLAILSDCILFEPTHAQILRQSICPNDLWQCSISWDYSSLLLLMLAIADPSCSCPSHATSKYTLIWRSAKQILGSAHLERWSISCLWCPAAIDMLENGKS